MFKITLKDIGTERVTKNLDCIAGILIDAEARAIEEASKVLGDREFSVNKVQDGQYIIREGDVLLGSFDIERIY